MSIPTPIQRDPYRRQGRCVDQLLDHIDAMEAALRKISTLGTYGEGDLPMTTSELREIAREALEK